MHQITIESINKFNAIEWSETVQAASKAAASRKAYAVIRSCGEAVNISKRVNEFDATIEVWRLQ
jgi:hypothetical protein